MSKSLIDLPAELTAILTAAAASKEEVPMDGPAVGSPPPDARVEHSFVLRARRHNPCRTRVLAGDGRQQRFADEAAQAAGSSTADGSPRSTPRTRTRSCTHSQAVKLVMFR